MVVYFDPEKANNLEGVLNVPTPERILLDFKQTGSEYC